jgi:transcriptional regulator with XRE-family HTH domain
LSKKAEIVLPPLNWVAERMGYSISGVSLLRNGGRRPTIDTMELIEEVFEWPILDQVQARRDGKFPDEFNKVTSEQYHTEKENA